MASTATSPTGTSRSLSPLPMTRTKPPSSGDVDAIERECFADAQPGRIEQLEEGSVAQADEVGAAGRLEELPDLLHVERVRQALRLARQVDEPGDIGADRAPPRSRNGRRHGSRQPCVAGSWVAAHAGAGPWPPGSGEPAPGRSTRRRCRAPAARRGAGRWCRRGSWPWPAHARRADSRCTRRRRPRGPRAGRMGGRPGRRPVAAWLACGTRLTRAGAPPSRAAGPRRAVRRGSG